MQNKKKLTSHVHLNNKNCHWCGQNNSYDLFTSFMTYILISYGIDLLLVFILNNNIFLDIAYDLSTYLIKIDWLNTSKSW